MAVLLELNGNQPKGLTVKQPGRIIANPGRGGQLNRENKYFPVLVRA